MRPPKCRTPINLKTLSREKREVYRQQAYAGFTSGKKAYAVAKELNLNESCVDNWYLRFRSEGSSALQERRRGPVPQTNAMLEEQEVQVLLKAVTGSTPDQLMFDFALWSSRLAEGTKGEGFVYARMPAELLARAEPGRISQPRREGRHGGTDVADRRSVGSRSRGITSVGTQENAGEGAPTVQEAGGALCGRRPGFGGVRFTPVIYGQHNNP